MFVILLMKTGISGAAIAAALLRRGRFFGIFRGPAASGQGDIPARDFGPALNPAFARAFSDWRNRFVMVRTKDGRKADIVKGPLPAGSRR